LVIGEYPEEKMNLIEEINKAQFERVGKFQLINIKIFGEQYQFYVPSDEDDENFEELVLLLRAMKVGSYEENRESKIKLNAQLKKMRKRVIAVRVFDKTNLPPLYCPEPVCGLYKIGRESYDSVLGFKLNKEDALL